MSPYRPGNYVGWASAEDGSSCDSRGEITENPATGQLETHSSGHCKPDYVTHYVIAVDGWVYTLQQQDFLWNIGHDVLSPVLPKNSPVFMRFDKNRKTVHVRIGKQE